ncbi:MAG TPA: SDR family NAD(P)-dependent oxidoreductase, partial [Ohtaekwangia sp.]
MSKKLTGKVAIVTGASAGIGWESALELAKEGAHVVLTARRESRLKELAEKITALGSKALIVIGDAADEATAKKTIAAAKSLGSIDILINNVGVGVYKNLVDTSAAEYDEMVDTNVRSTFLFTRYAVPVMIEQKQGTI